jgi:hypothetical protein
MLVRGFVTVLRGCGTLALAHRGLRPGARHFE